MLPSLSRILAEAINTMHLISTYRTIDRMEKEIHYALTRPIIKVISTGNLKIVIYFYFLHPFWCELIVGLQTLDAFNSSLVSGHNENKK